MPAGESYEHAKLSNMAEQFAVSFPMVSFSGWL
jgi:hypothetical protein